MSIQVRQPYCDPEKLNNEFSTVFFFTYIYSQENIFAAARMRFIFTDLFSRCAGNYAIFFRPKEHMST